MVVPGERTVVVGARTAALPRRAALATFFIDDEDFRHECRLTEHLESLTCVPEILDVFERGEVRARPWQKDVCIVSLASAPSRT